MALYRGRPIGTLGNALMAIDYAAILARKLTAIFPADADRSDAENILMTYGVERYEREAARVRLAVLKIAGANLSELRRHVAVAKRDYRDTLAAAEYPAQMRGPISPDPTERQRLVAEDTEAYAAWLSR